MAVTIFRELCIPTQPVATVLLRPYYNIISITTAHPWEVSCGALQLCLAFRNPLKAYFYAKYVNRIVPRVQRSKTPRRLFTSDALSWATRKMPKKKTV